MDLGEVEKQAHLAIARLWELIRSVEDRGNSPDIKAKAEQLREVAGSIQRLEKRKVPVPEDLRRLKLTLHMEVHPEEDMTRFHNTLRKEIGNIAVHLRVPGVSKSSAPKRAVRQPRVPVTPQTSYREHIVAVLKANGGRAHCHVVYDWVEKQFKGKFLPGDLARRKHGELVWKNNVAWQRMAMVNDGILKRKSSQGIGIWELQEAKP